MERRDALKSISLAMGYAVTPATFAGLLTSCRPEAVNGREPAFLSQAAYRIVAELGEAFLPQTETPGSKSVNAHAFVDVFLAKVADPEGQELFSRGLEHWRAAFESDFGKSIEDATPEEYKAALAKFFQVDEARQLEIKQLIRGEEPQDPVRREEFLVYQFLFTVKRLIMLGFYESEEIGENVLSYLPVPGKYEPCIPVEEVGNVWSL